MAKIVREGNCAFKVISDVSKSGREYKRIVLKFKNGYVLGDQNFILINADQYLLSGVDKLPE